MKLAMFLFGALLLVDAHAGSDCSHQAASAVKRCRSRLDSAKDTSTIRAYRTAEENCEKKDEKSCVDSCGRASATASRQGNLDLSELNDQIQSSCRAQINNLLDLADDAKEKLTVVSHEAKAAAKVIFTGEVTDSAEVSRRPDNVVAKPICFNQGGVVKSTTAVPLAQIEQSLQAIKDGYFGPDATIVPCPDVNPLSF